MRKYYLDDGTYHDNERDNKFPLISEEVRRTPTNKDVYKVDM